MWDKGERVAEGQPPTRYGPHDATMIFLAYGTGFAPASWSGRAGISASSAKGISTSGG
jgi:hypothetical protein